MDRFSILAPFWNRIKHRVLTLTKDKNVKVAKVALELVNIMLQGNQLEMGYGDDILNWIFDENQYIREQAALFTYYDTVAEENASTTAHDKYRHEVNQLVKLMKDRIIDLYNNMGEILATYSSKCNTLYECHLSEKLNNQSNKKSEMAVTRNLKKNNSNHIAVDGTIDKNNQSRSSKTWIDDANNCKWNGYGSFLNVTTNELRTHYIQVSDYIVLSMIDKFNVLTV